MVVWKEIVICEEASDELTRIAYYIESNGMPLAAKKFFTDALMFFESLGNPIVSHRLCAYKEWQLSGYRCAQFRKKYVVAFQDFTDKIVIVDFANAKVVHHALERHKRTKRNKN